MKNKLLVVLIAFFAFFQLNSTQILKYTFKGSGSCTTSAPCNLDDGSLWTVTSPGKRSEQEALGEPTSPSAQTKLFEIEIPYSFAIQPYVLQSNSNGYTLRGIHIRGYATKREQEEEQNVLATTISTGITIIFSDTTLNNFTRYEIGSEFAKHSLIFENVVVQPDNLNVDGDCVQRANSVFHIKGTTNYNIRCNYIGLSVNDTYIMDPEVSITNPYNDFVKSESTDSYANLHGILDVNRWTCGLQFLKADITGLRITAKQGIAFNCQVYVGTKDSDAGSITKLKTHTNIYQATMTFDKQTITEFTGFSMELSTMNVINGASVYVEGQDIFMKQATINIDGDAKVFLNSRFSPASSNNGLPTVINVYDGLLQLVDMKPAFDTGGGTINLYNSNSGIIFNGNVVDSFLSATITFNFAKGCSITINTQQFNLSVPLPDKGINYIFGAITWEPPTRTIMTISEGGSIILNGTSVNGMDITIKDSGFGGFGEVEQDVILSVTNASLGTPKFSLPFVGKTLSVAGKVKIPDSTILSVTLDNSHSCGKLVVGTLDIESDVSFELKFEDQPPAYDPFSNTTYVYVIAEYTTLVGTIPPSPNQDLFNVIHDSTNKIIKVQYFPPVVIPTNQIGSSSTSTPSSIISFILLVIFSMIIA